MSKIEELICTRIDLRLAEPSLELMDVNLHIAITRLALAADLGTAQEVIGRMFNNFERAGWLKLSRGAINIVDAGALCLLISSKSD